MVYTHISKLRDPPAASIYRRITLSTCSRSMTPLGAARVNTESCYQMLPSQGDLGP